jgi:D-alanyl-D-alanine carboxypeptidase/D-alanyl-D-alanine-endopeptidase (penicillin-binding protein 4)
MHVLIAIAALLAGAEAPPLCHAPEPAIGACAAELAATQPDFAARVASAARRSLGTPYAAGPLGEGPGGQVDTDPLVDFTRADCVTFVEQTLAVASSDSWDALRARLDQIRYRDGVVSFQTRNHFMLADWVRNNAFCRDVTAELGEPVTAVTRTVGREKVYEANDALALLPEAPAETLTVDVLPVEAAARVDGRIPSPSLVCFVGRPDWLFALHCGLFVREGDGPGQLYHASSAAGEVTATGLAAYLGSTDRYIGFTVHALSEPAAAPRD